MILDNLNWEREEEGEGGKEGWRERKQTEDKKKTARLVNSIL